MKQNELKAAGTRHRITNKGAIIKITIVQSKDIIHDLLNYINITIRYRRTRNNSAKEFK